MITVRIAILACQFFIGMYCLIMCVTLQVLKTALRACADWTEHLSSSGKIYYYNCKTEVSRWDKPKEWGTEA